MMALLTRMIRCFQMFHAIFNPAYWLPDIPGNEGDQKVFRVKFTACAKTAPHIRLNKVNERRIAVQQPCEDDTVEVNNLCWPIDVDASLFVRYRYQATRLHWNSSMTLNAKIQSQSIGGLA